MDFLSVDDYEDELDPHEPCGGCGREPGECVCPDDLYEFDPLGELSGYDPDWDEYVGDISYDDENDAEPQALS